MHRRLYRKERATHGGSETWQQASRECIRLCVPCRNRLRSAWVCLQLLRGQAHQKAPAGCLVGCDPSYQVLDKACRAEYCFQRSVHWLLAKLMLQLTWHGYAESLGGAKSQQDEEELSLDSNKLMT